MGSKIITRVVTAAVAVSVAAGTAAAQDVGTPQHIGNIHPPQEYLNNAINGLSSQDPNQRSEGLGQLHLALLVGSGQLLHSPLLFLGSISS